jgi:hypothetical protein
MIKWNVCDLIYSNTGSWGRDAVEGVLWTTSQLESIPNMRNS